MGESSAAGGTIIGRGIRRGLGMPGWVLFASFLGFGAFVEAADLGFDHALAMVILVWALPSKVILVTSISEGVGLVATFGAVALSAVRMMPMTVALIPELRVPDAPRWPDFIAAQFVAITVWIAMIRDLPDIPVADRRRYFLAIGITCMVMGLIGTVIGYAMAGRVPSLVTAALLFMTPIYFALSMAGAARERLDLMAVAAGLILGPVFIHLTPQLDLLWTGLVGGTVVYLIDRLGRGR